MTPSIKIDSYLSVDAMPYCWEMFQLIRHNWYSGFNFFCPNSVERALFSVRIQRIPPYKGRVFVTSERGYYGRSYTVRMIKPNGRVVKVTEYGEFNTRYAAHAFARSFAEENFWRWDNVSIKMPVEMKSL